MKNGLSYSARMACTTGGGSVVDVSGGMMCGLVDFGTGEIIGTLGIC